MSFQQICRTIGRVTALFSISLSSLASAAPVNGTTGAKNAQDIAVIDRALATAKPGQDYVVFGDVGVKPEILKIFRKRLVAEQSGPSGPKPMPDADTPPGTTFKWTGGSVPYRFDPTQVREWHDYRGQDAAVSRWHRRMGGLCQCGFL